VAVTSESARLLRLFIGDFHPLVYHQHPGATAIVQRLGRIMVRQPCGSRTCLCQTVGSSCSPEHVP
jgi:hypothetical protein